MEFSAAIFDVDGTLLDSMPLWEHVGEQYLIEKGCIPKPGMEERVRTMSMSQIADYCRTEYGIADSPETIIEEINGMVLEQYRTQVQAKPGIPELLERLALGTHQDRYLPQVQAFFRRSGLDDVIAQANTFASDTAWLPQRYRELEAFGRQIQEGLV